MCNEEEEKMAVVESDLKGKLSDLKKRAENRKKQSTISQAKNI